MSESVKVTIRLPRGLLELVDQERRESRESRSAFFRRALETQLATRRERETDECYVAGYRKQPETEDEVAATWAVSAGVLAGEPWE